jgi:hypothetical protein
MFSQKMLPLGVTVCLTSGLLSTVPQTALAFSQEIFTHSSQNTFILAKSLIYTVRLGDTLSGIAARHGLSLSKLLQYNPSLRKNPRLIRVGQKINLSLGQSAKPVLKTPPKQRKTAFRNLNLPNQRRSGASRVGAKRGSGDSCLKDSNTQLRALLPDTNFGYTLQDYPTFFWYVPELKDAQIPVRFTLRKVVAPQNPKPDDQVGAIIYQKTFNQTSSGIISFSLPPNAPKLEEEEEYEWEAIIQCSDNTIIRTRGRIQRLNTNNSQLSTQLENAALEDYPAILARAGVWYDALAILDALRQENPNDQSLATDWGQILQQIGFGDLEKVPVMPF